MTRHRRRSTQVSVLSEQSVGGSHLRVLSSNVSFSIMTDTNSTTSSIFGPGRSVGALLSASGRRFEGMVNRTAERLGYGPNAIMTRLLNCLRQSHERLRTCKGSPRNSRSSPRTTLSFTDLVDNAMLLGSSACPKCRRPFFMGFVRTSEIEELVQKLLSLISQGVASTKYLAVYYLNVTAMLDDTLRTLVLKLGGTDILRSLQSHVLTAAWVEPEWTALEEPLRQVLHSLDSPIHWFSMFHQQIGESDDMALYSQICEEVSALVGHSKSVHCSTSHTLRLTSC
jgi:hypothetical protein